VTYCDSVCTDDAPFDGTGKRVLISMFSGNIVTYSSLSGEFEILFPHLT